MFTDQQMYLRLLVNPIFSSCSCCSFFFSISRNQPFVMSERARRCLSKGSQQHLQQIQALLSVGTLFLFPSKQVEGVAEI